MKVESQNSNYEKYFSVLVISVSLTSFSQAKNGAVKVNALALLFRIVNFSYEHALCEKNSAQLGISITSSSLGDTRLSGLGVSPEFCFYTRQALDNFYIAPLINIRGFSAEDDFVRADVKSFGVDVKIGWDWLLGSKDSFVIDLGLGAHSQSNSVELTSGTTNNLDFGSIDGIAIILNFR